MFSVFLPVFAGAGGDVPMPGRSGAVQIKMASIAPEASPWGEALNKLTENVRRDTDGQVEIIVYHNGVAGSEADMVRKLKMDQIQSVVVTSFGINIMTPEIMTFSCPFLIRTDEEVYYVLDHLKPYMNEKISRAGFQPAAWSHVGFVKIFTRYPGYRTPAKLKETTFAGPTTDQSMVNVFKESGYKIATVETNDMLLALNSGRIDSFYNEPIYAASLQIFAAAKNMLDFNLAPALGGIFLNNTTWNKLNAEQKNIVLKYSLEAEDSINTALTKLEADAMSVMAKNGLNIEKVTPSELKLWYDDMERVLPKLVGPGKEFDQDTYNRINELLIQFRAEKGK
jgi:TRAP-type C4-dicarboxylate transport system substrate-binding protein